MTLSEHQLRVLDAGNQLRAIREQLGFSLRDVEATSDRLAEAYGLPDLAIGVTTLSDMETKGSTPSIYRLYSLAVIYRRDPREILSFYGLDVNRMAAAQVLSEPPKKTHYSTALQASTSLRIPVGLDPAFDLRATVNIGRMIERWGTVPIGYLSQFEDRNYTYGYIGIEDFTMYPVLLPGSFIQIDEEKTSVLNGAWRSEYERPIYFVETRSGYVCCWCNLSGSQITLLPHPLSPVLPRVLKYRSEAEVIGQVVAIAMRLDDFRHAPPEPGHRGRPKLS